MSKEITLNECLKVVNQNKYKMLTIIAFMMCLGTMFVYQMPDEWDGNVRLDIKKTVSIFSAEPTISLIETPARVIERLKSDEYIKNFLGKLGLDYEDKEAKLLLDSLRISANSLNNNPFDKTPIESRDHLYISLRNYSPQRVREALEVMINLLTTSHDELEKTNREYVNNYLALQSQHLEILKKNQALFEKAKVLPNFNPDRNTLLLSSTLSEYSSVVENTDVRKMENLILRIKQFQSLADVSKTSPSFGLNIGHKPISVQKLYSFSIFLVLGVLFAILFAFLNYRRSSSIKIQNVMNENLA